MEINEQISNEIKEKIEKALDEGGKINFAEFGFDGETLKTLEPLIKKIMEEIKNERFLFAKEEKIIIDGKNDAVKTIGGLLIKNIMSMRGFLLTLTTVSLAVIGIVISNLIIFQIPLVYFGLAPLVICIFVSIIYLTHIHVRENNELTENLNFQKKAFRELHDILIEYLKERKKFEDYLKQKEILSDKNRETEKKFIEKIDKRAERKDYIPHIVSTSFLLGISLIALSFFIQ